MSRFKKHYKEYFDRTWEPTSKLWIRGHDNSWVATTNNFNEGHFSSLKYRYLGRRRNFRIDELVVALVTIVVPDIQIRLFNDIVQQNCIDLVVSAAQGDDEISDEEKIADLRQQFSFLTKKILNETQISVLNRDVVIAALRKLAE